MDLPSQDATGSAAALCAGVSRHGHNDICSHSPRRPRPPPEGPTSDRPTQQTPHALDIGRLHVMLNIHTRFCDNIGIGFQISSRSFVGCDLDSEAEAI